MFDKLFKVLCRLLEEWVMYRCHDGAVRMQPAIMVGESAVCMHSVIRRLITALNPGLHRT
jgi:hypothetical protein